MSECAGHSWFFVLIPELNRNRCDLFAAVFQSDFLQVALRALEAFFKIFFWRAHLGTNCCFWLKLGVSRKRTFSDCRAALITFNFLLGWSFSWFTQDAYLLRIEVLLTDVWVLWVESLIMNILSQFSLTYTITRFFPYRSDQSTLDMLGHLGWLVCDMLFFDHCVAMMVSWARFCRTGLQWHSTFSTD